MILLENRKVRFDYEIIETVETGMVLFGWEVKSLKTKNANMKSAWVKIKNGEAFLKNLKIALWRFSREEQDPLRERKLLLHKTELLRLDAKMREKNLTLVPYKIYLKKGRIKCEICLVKGRKKYEKRQVLKERDQKREAQKMLKNY
jgi:SsrA-binding protein